MPNERIWRTGDAVLLTCAGQTVPAVISLASGNGRSLVLAFEAILGGHVGTMPVAWSPTGATALFSGAPVQIQAWVEP